MQPPNTQCLFLKNGNIVHLQGILPIEVHWVNVLGFGSAQHFQFPNEWHFIKSYIIHHRILVIITKDYRYEILLITSSPKPLFTFLKFLSSEYK